MSRRQRSCVGSIRPLTHIEREEGVFCLYRWVIIIFVCATVLSHYEIFIYFFFSYQSTPGNNFVIDYSELLAQPHSVYIIRCTAKVFT